jgi:hypothetical protein
LARTQGLLFLPGEIVRRTGRALWTLLKRAWLGVLLIGGLGTFLVFLIFFVPPDTELCWIDSSNGYPVASRLPAERWMPESVVDLYRHRVRLPVRLGIRNRSWLPLYNVEITIQYPRVQVESSAHPLASEDSSVIMQHTVGALLPGRAFTPLGDADQVLIPVDSLLSAAFVLDGAGVPQYVEAARNFSRPTPSSSLELGVVARVTAAGRVRQHVQQLTVPMWLERQEWWPPPIGMKERPATAQEGQLFADFFREGVGDTVFGGVMSTMRTHRRIRWECVKTALGRFTGFSVDGRPTRLQADTNSDWLVDFDLLARPGGGGKITLTRYSEARPMDLPFVPSALKPALPGETMVPVSRLRLRK